MESRVNPTRSTGNINTESAKDTENDSDDITIVKEYITGTNRSARNILQKGFSLQKRPTMPQLSMGLQEKGVYQNLLKQNISVTDDEPIIIFSSHENTMTDTYFSFIHKNYNQKDDIETLKNFVNCKKEISAKRGSQNDLSKSYINIQETPGQKLVSNSDREIGKREIPTPISHLRGYGITNPEIVGQNFITEILESGKEKQKQIDEAQRLEQLLKEESQKYQELSCKLEKNVFKKIDKPGPVEIKKVPITAEMTEEISQAVAGKKETDPLVTTKGGIVRVVDIKTLYDLNWLNDEVINTYMNLIAERGTRDDYMGVHCFNTFFYQRLIDAGYSGVKRWTKKADIFSARFIFAPILFRLHWCLICIDTKQKIIKYYDSMGSANNNCLTSILIYLKEEHMDKKKTALNTYEWKLENTLKSIPQQMNGSDCSVFACTFAEYLSRGASFDFSQSDMPYFRRKMLYEILTKNLLL